MVTDQEISRCVESLLRQSPPGSVNSVSAFVSEVSSQLGGLDLTHKEAFIRDRIKSLLLPPSPSPPPPQKDHFALQPHPQFQFHPSHFPNYPHHHHHQQEGPVTAQFGYSLSPPPPSQPPQFQLIQQQKQAVNSPPVVRPVAVVAAAPSPKESSHAGVKRRGGPGGLSKVCGVSPELQAIVGEPTMARTQIVKQLWAYIRKNNLQDPANKRKIICNDELRLVFETDCTDMFKMNKLLTKHILPLDPAKDTGPDAKRLKVTAADDVSSATDTLTDIDTKNSSVVVSDALADFFGTGEREMHESEVLRRVWDYIKTNNLQDPVNTMVISCDTKLQLLFGCEKLLALGIVELVSRHFKQC